MIRFYILPIAFFFVYQVVIGQNQNNFCGQQAMLENLFKDRPDLSKKFFESQKPAPSTGKNENSTNSTATEPNFIIPVVFHILHQGGPENISDAQVIDEVRILNRDFQKQNADTSIIVPAFQNNIANVGFGFKLARIDPNGQCTNGIIRHVTSKTNWDANNLNDFTYSWPRNKYLNIYVVKTMNITATAYAFLPGTPIPASADVIVSMHQMVGSIGTGNVANSRVLTHEVGHWFGLQHIWGTSNQPGVVCGDDLVADTPETKGFITCATSNTGICNPGIVENVQNYMDYAPCKIMFTNGQKDRMLSFITGTLNGRNNVYSAANLEAAGVAGPNYVCSPSVDFKTNGIKKCLQTMVTFTSFTQTGQASGTRLWTFEGGSPATSTDSIVQVTYLSPGTYDVSLQVTSSGGGSTTEMREDYIAIEDGSQGDPAPSTFNFETDSLIAKLKVINFDSQSVAWKRFESGGALSTSKSFTINSYNDFMEITGEKDAFELPYLNLSDYEEINLSYYYAYARLTNAHRDSFKVQYSLDCGGNWTTVAGLPTTTQMAAASGGISVDEFVPTAGQWVQQVIPTSRLSALAHQNRVKIRFLFVKDVTKTLTNNVYLDQIQVNGTLTGIRQQVGKKQVAIFPNPSAGSFTVKIDMDEKADPAAQLFDAKGRELPGLVEKNHTGEMVINSGNTLNKGVYTLMLNLDGQMLPQKLVVN